MNYISPVKLFYEDLQDKQGEITAKDLSLIRRKLLAEAELSENKTVVRDGVEYSKEDIISTFDEMDKDMRMDMHLRVFNNKSLLKFLETGEFDFMDEPISGEEIKEDPAFREFIQPWFVPVWQEAILKELRERQFYNLTVFMVLGKQVIEENLLIEVMESFEARLWDFDEAAKEQSNIIKDTKQVDEEETDTFISTFLINFLNELPYTFSNFRNHYMIAMVNITVQLFNAGHKGLAVAYGKVAIGLDCDDFYKDQMKERLVLYKGSRTKTTGSCGGFPRYVWFIIVFISTIARVGTCNEYNNSNSFKPGYQITGNGMPSNVPVTLSTALNRRQTIYISKPDGESVFPLADSDCLSNAIIDTGNRRFVRELDIMLKLNLINLKSQPYPVGELKNYSVNTSTLQRVINTNWNPQDEYVHPNNQNARLIAYNETRTPMFLLYKTGPNLKVEPIEPGAFIDINLSEGKTLMIPYLGVGWNPYVKMGGALAGKYSILNQGWFNAQTDSSGGLQNNIGLYSVRPLEPYADTMIYYYQPEDGYYAILHGSNIKRLASKSTLSQY